MRNFEETYDKGMLKRKLHLLEHLADDIDLL